MRSKTKAISTEPRTQGQALSKGDTTSVGQAHALLTYRCIPYANTAKAASQRQQTCITSMARDQADLEAMTYSTFKPFATCTTLKRRQENSLEVGMPDERDLAWLAGFFDGEGCIHVTPRGRLHVHVSQREPEPLIAFTRYGSRVTAAPKGQHQWQLTGPKAAAFLREVRPFLRVKAAKADAALDNPGGQPESV